MSLPPPLGVLNVRLDWLIDVDETGVYLNSIRSLYGRGHTAYRTRTPTHYTRNDRKVNVIMAVEAGSPLVPPFWDGSIQFPRRWIFISQGNCD